MKTQQFATRLPADLTGALDVVCKKYGMRKNFVIESALREKIEDILDGEDLREAMLEAVSFHDWSDVKKELKSKKNNRKAVKV